MVRPTNLKNEESADIERQTKEYLTKGGKVHKIPTGKSGTEVPAVRKSMRIKPWQKRQTVE